MTLRSTIAATLVGFFALTGSAQAVEIDYNGTNTDMGTVVAGQYGVLNNNYDVVLVNPSPALYFDTSFAFGYLAPHSIITFTYTLPGLVAGSVSMHSSYDFMFSGDHYEGQADAADSTFGSTSSTSSSSVNGIGSAPIVFASANIGANTATTQVVNLSDGLVNFKTFFSGVLSQLGATLTYNVSSVPLPAAFPMFGAMIAGLFGFARRQRRKVAAA